MAKPGKLVNAASFLIAQPSNKPTPTPPRRGRSYHLPLLGGVPVGRGGLAPPERNLQFAKCNLPLPLPRGDFATKFPSSEG